MRHVKRNKRRGQGMTEYFIIVALVAISAIAVVRNTSVGLKNGFAKIANALDNRDESNGTTSVSITQEMTKGNSLKDFSAGAKR